MDGGNDLLSVVTNSEMHIKKLGVRILRKMVGTEIFSSLYFEVNENVNDLAGYTPGSTMEHGTYCTVTILCNY
jgi:hypothetical protein